MKTTTNLFSASMLQRLLNTQHPLLLALAKKQRARVTSAQHRAFTIKEKKKAVMEMTYLPKGKKVVFSEEGSWTKQNRLSITISPGLSLICRTLKVKYTKEQIITAENLLLTKRVYVKPVVPKKAKPGKAGVKLVSGKDIQAYYDQPESRVSSCMRKQDKGYFELYADNPAIQLAVYLNEQGVMMARALVWNCLNKMVLMDRIYDGEYQESAAAESLRNYARKYGWHQREETGNTCIAPSGKSVRYEDIHPFVIKTGKRYDRYPSLDTMRTIYGDVYISTPGLIAPGIHKHKPLHDKLVAEHEKSKKKLKAKKAA